MGILNVSNNSFYDGGKFISKDAILKQADKMLTEGATMLDIGGMSTNPKANLLTVNEELKNIEQPFSLLQQYFPDAILSIDTFRSEVATAAIQLGATVINDISGGDEDKQLFNVAAKYHCPYIMMHRRGDFMTMHQPAEYQHFLAEIIDDFTRKIAVATEAGVTDIIIDPGFSFSKSLEQNYYLLKNLAILNVFERPLLSGISRKSMLYKVLNITAHEALNATTAANMVALTNGALILRVHDVKEAVECITIFNQLNK